MPDATKRSQDSFSPLQRDAAQRLHELRRRLKEKPEDALAYYSRYILPVTMFRYQPFGEFVRERRLDLLLPKVCERAINKATAAGVLDRKTMPTLSTHGDYSVVPLAMHFLGIQDPMFVYGLGTLVGKSTVLFFFPREAIGLMCIDPGADQICYIEARDPSKLPPPEFIYVDKQGKPII